MIPSDLEALEGIQDGVMPVLFIGHGSPMNAIEDNPFSKMWRQVGARLPRPKAILCISAHWETRGPQVTAMETPKTIHDFSGFPAALYHADYQAPGSLWLAEEVRRSVRRKTLELDHSWGLDHGCWSVLKQMYPTADIPVAQLSLDFNQPAPAHYELARQLASLRRCGVLIIGSGNIVHNLRRVSLPGNDYARFNEPYGLDWALEASEMFKRCIDEDNHKDLINYPLLGRAAQLAVPTPEHFLPLLYALALKQPHECVTYFNDQPLAGALSMTSLVIDSRPFPLM